MCLSSVGTTLQVSPAEDKLSEAARGTSLMEVHRGEGESSVEADQQGPCR